MNEWFIKFILILHVTLKNSSGIIRGRNCSSSHSTEAETEAQRGTASCPQSHSKLVTEPGVKLGLFMTRPLSFHFLDLSHLFSFVLAFMRSTKLFYGVEMTFGNSRSENKALPESKP